MACLDTSFLLDLAGRGGKKLQQRARKKAVELATADEVMSTTRFNVAELWVGIERSADREMEQSAVEQLLNPLIILDFDDMSARTFGRLAAYLQDQGLAVADMDILIASVALVNGHSMVTLNTKHFKHIPGLFVESY